MSKRKLFRRRGMKRVIPLANEATKVLGCAVALYSQEMAGLRYLIRQYQQRYGPPPTDDYQPKSLAIRSIPLQ